MKLFLISQSDNNGYDTYDSAVVCAPDEDSARMMDPGGKNGDPAKFNSNHWCTSWATSVDKVNVELIGDAVQGLPIGVVCSSYNAG